MNIFDIMGPIMVGPSSSHTAGAARIGYLTRKLLGSQPKRAELLLHGSFAATGAGHGTDRALAAGLLGMQPDDARLPRSFELAEAAGMELKLGKTVLRGAHPNTVLLKVEDEAGKRLEVTASSLGGGRVQVCAIDGLEARFTGELPTLIIRNQDGGGGHRGAVPPEREHRHHAALPQHPGRPGGDGHRERPAHLGGRGGGAARLPGH